MIKIESIEDAQIYCDDCVSMSDNELIFCAARHQIVTLPDLRIHNKVEVRRVDIGVTDHFLLRQ